MGALYHVKARTSGTPFREGSTHDFTGRGAPVFDLNSIFFFEGLVNNTHHLGRNSPIDHYLAILLSCLHIHHAGPGDHGDYQE